LAFNVEISVTEGYARLPLRIHVSRKICAASLRIRSVSEARPFFMNLFSLLAASALSGVLLGLNYFGLGAVLISTLIVCVLATAILQHAAFGFFPGIAIVVGCQTVHQLGFALGSMLVNRGRD
jgi:hypothetical protein